MRTGTVKWYNTEKGYGFLVPDDGGKDIFFHVTELQKANINSVPDGMRLSFDLGQNRGKDVAINIREA